MGIAKQIQTSKHQKGRMCKRSRMVDIGIQINIMRCTTYNDTKCKQTKLGEVEFCEMCPAEE